MTQEIVNKAIVLYRLSLSPEEVKKAQEVYFLEPEFEKLLNNPTLSLDKKNQVIDKVFSKAGISDKMTGFIKMMCKLGYASDMQNIFDAYYKYWDKQNKILRADLISAEVADEELVSSAKEMLLEDYPDYKVVLTNSVDENLIGGYVIRLDGMEYDHSYEGRLRQLERKITGR